MVALLNVNSFNPLLGTVVLSIAPLFSLCAITGPIFTVKSIYGKIKHDKNKGAELDNNKSQLANTYDGTSTDDTTTLFFLLSIFMIGSYRQKATTDSSVNLPCDKVDSRTNLAQPDSPAKTAVNATGPSINRAVVQRPVSKSQLRSTRTYPLTTHPQRSYSHSSDVQFLQRQGVEYLYHFTCVDNLPSILENGILSVVN